MRYTNQEISADKELDLTTPFRRILEWNGPFPNWLTGAWLPLFVYIVAYAATTVVGATFFLTPAGRSDLANFLGTLNSKVTSEIGSPVYLSLLFLPFLIAPPFAYAGIYLTRALASRLDLPSAVLNPKVPRFALWAFAILSCAYCIYSLHAMNALFPELLLNPDATYQERIVQRTYLFDTLSPVFFIVTYGFIPIFSSIFLINFAKRGHNYIDIIGFIVTFISFYIVIFNLYSKSHILVFSIMLAAAILTSRSSFWYIILAGAVSFISFIALEALISGMWAPIAAHSGSSHTIVQETLNAPPEKQEVTANQAIAHLRGLVSQGMFFRMASGFPFYVSIFADPSARCGIEAHTVRRVLGISPSRCSLPTKVFPVMYPDVTWVAGFAPAPAHVSAYGELGFSWSLIVMALTGFCLGIVGAITSLGKGPLFAAIGVASCTFAYYLSQLPFIAAFTYGHGLIFLMLPVLTLFGISLMNNWLFSGRKTQVSCG